MEGAGKEDTGGAGGGGGGGRLYRFIAWMQPSYTMRSDDAFDEIPLAVRDSHWLTIPAGDGKLLWETMPCLLGGGLPWDTDVTSFPQPSLKPNSAGLGRRGSPWWVAVNGGGLPGLSWRRISGTFL